MKHISVILHEEFHWNDESKMADHFCGQWLPNKQKHASFFESGVSLTEDKFTSINLEAFVNTENTAVLRFITDFRSNDDS